MTLLTQMRPLAAIRVVRRSWVALTAPCGLPERRRCAAPALDRGHNSLQLAPVVPDPSRPGALRANLALTGDLYPKGKTACESHISPATTMIRCVYAQSGQQVIRVSRASSLGAMQVALSRRWARLAPRSSTFLVVSTAYS